MNRAYLTLGIAWISIYILDVLVEASISLGSCSLSCNENEEDAHQLLGPRHPQQIPGPPGKSGPVGLKGSRGLTGPEGPQGPPGTACDCTRYRDMLQELKETVEAMKGLTQPEDCVHAKSEISTSGSIIIFPFGRNSTGHHVYCDQHTDAGGWIVFQRRMDGSENFFREWGDYVKGFGDKESEMWLGLDLIQRLTNNGSYELRIDLEDFSGNKAFAKYSTFKVTGPEDNYRITVTGYSGSAGNGLAHHNNAQFSTKEVDNDGHETYNCAAGHKGGWWYNKCHHSNLNGKYFDSPDVTTLGITWLQWKKSYESLKHVEMKMRYKQTV